MRRIAFLVAFLLAASSAWAQTAETPIPTSPPRLSGYGIVAITSAGSTALSTVTLGPNSNPYPTPGTLTSFYVSVRNSVGSSNTIFVCWFGGNCTSSNGEPLAVGETAVRNLGFSTTVPTATSSGSSTVIVGW